MCKQSKRQLDIMSEVADNLMLMDSLFIDEFLGFLQLSHDCGLVALSLDQIQEPVKTKAVQTIANACTRASALLEFVKSITGLAVESCIRSTLQDEMLTEWMIKLLLEITRISHENMDDRIYSLILNDLERILQLMHQPTLAPTIIEIVYTISNYSRSPVLGHFRVLMDLTVQWISKTEFELILDYLIKLWPFWSLEAEFGLEMADQLMDDLQKTTDLTIDLTDVFAKVEKSKGTLVNSAIGLAKSCFCVLNSVAYATLGSFNSFVLKNKNVGLEKRVYRFFSILNAVYAKYGDAEWKKLSIYSVLQLSNLYVTEFEELRDVAFLILMTELDQTTSTSISVKKNGMDSSVFETLGRVKVYLQPLMAADKSLALNLLFNPVKSPVLNNFKSLYYQEPLVLTSYFAIGAPVFAKLPMNSIQQIVDCLIAETEYLVASQSSGKLLEWTSNYPKLFKYYPDLVACYSNIVQFNLECLYELAKFNDFKPLFIEKMIYFHGTITSLNSGDGRYYKILSTLSSSIVLISTNEQLITPNLLEFIHGLISSSCVTNVLLALVWLKNAKTCPLELQKTWLLVVETVATCSDSNIVDACLDSIGGIADLDIVFPDYKRLYKVLSTCSLHSKKCHEILIRMNPLKLAVLEYNHLNIDYTSRLFFTKNVWWFGNEEFSMFCSWIGLDFSQISANWYLDLFEKYGGIHAFNGIKIENSKSIKQQVASDWIVSQAVHFCINNKLKTRLGSPDVFFKLLESRLYVLVNGVDISNTSHFIVRSRLTVLVKFIDLMERLMMYISDTVGEKHQLFYSNNKRVSIEWFSRIRFQLINACSISFQCLEIQLRNCLQWFNSTQKKAQDEEIYRVFVLGIEAAHRLNKPAFIRNMVAFVQSKTSLSGLHSLVDYYEGIDYALDRYSVSSSAGDLFNSMIIKPRLECSSTQSNPIAMFGSDGIQKLANWSDILEGGTSINVKIANEFSSKKLQFVQPLEMLDTVNSAFISCLNLITKDPNALVSKLQEQCGETEDIRYFTHNSGHANLLIPNPSKKPAGILTDFICKAISQPKLAVQTQSDGMYKLDKVYGLIGATSGSLVAMNDYLVGRFKEAFYKLNSVAITDVNLDLIRMKLDLSHKFHTLSSTLDHVSPLYDPTNFRSVELLNLLLEFSQKQLSQVKTLIRAKSIEGPSVVSLSAAPRNRRPSSIVEQIDPVATYQEMLTSGLINHPSDRSIHEKYYRFYYEKFKQIVQNPLVWLQPRLGPRNVQLLNIYALKKAVVNSRKELVAADFEQIWISEPQDDAMSKSDMNLIIKKMVNSTMQYLDNCWQVLNRLLAKFSTDQNSFMHFMHIFTHQSHLVEPPKDFSTFSIEFLMFHKHRFVSRLLHSTCETSALFLQEIYSRDPNLVIYDLAYIKVCSKFDPVIKKSAASPILAKLLEEAPIRIAGKFFIELQKLAHLPEDEWIYAIKRKHQLVVECIEQLETSAIQNNINTGYMSQQQQQNNNQVVANVQKALLPLVQLFQFLINKPITNEHRKQFNQLFKSSILKGIDALKTSVNYIQLKEAWSIFKTMLLKMQERSKILAKLQLSSLSSFLCSINETGLVVPGSRAQIDSFSSEIQWFPTKTRPKKLKMTGSDGLEYSFLLKATEDLRVDRLFMDISNWTSQFLQEKVTTFNIFPVSDTVGLVEWVNGKTQIYALLRETIDRNAPKEPPPAKLEERRPTTSGKRMSTASRKPLNRPFTSNRPSDQFHRVLNQFAEQEYNRVMQELAAAQATQAAAEAAAKSSKNKQKPEIPKQVTQSILQPKQLYYSSPESVPIEYLLKTFKLLDQSVPNDVIFNALQSSCTSALELLNKQQAFIDSMAINSAIGYMCGLGDRHLDNILLDLSTGHVMHIDFNVLFEKGLDLRIPETVNFRLTKNFAYAMGIGATTGQFSMVLLKVLNLFKEFKDSWIHMLDCFLVDPVAEFDLMNIGSKYSVSLVLEESAQQTDVVQDVKKEGELLDGFSLSDIKSEHQETASFKAQTVITRLFEKVEFNDSIADELVENATDEKKLCRMYPGWMSWV